RPLAGLSAESEVAGDRRAEAFAAWRQLLEALADPQPVVLVFEDMHWADEGLLDFVDYLVDWASGVPLLVVGTARPELLERPPGSTRSRPRRRRSSSTPPSTGRSFGPAGLSTANRLTAGSWRSGCTVSSARSSSSARAALRLPARPSTRSATFCCGTSRMARSRVPPARSATARPPSGTSRWGRP